MSHRDLGRVSYGFMDFSSALQVFFQGFIRFGGFYGSFPAGFPCPKASKLQHATPNLPQLLSKQNTAILLG